MQLDISLLERHRPPALPHPKDHCFVNWLGLQTDARLFMHQADIVGRVFNELPLGGLGDGVYGGVMEYSSVLTAIEATPNRDRFTAVELGAGWGPWISAAGIACKRLGFKEIDLIGLEADRARCDLMKDHMARNGLAECTKITWGAAWPRNEDVYFPAIDPRDHGGAARSEAGGIDYRGHATQNDIQTPGFNIEAIAGSRDRVDYMHWDIQGGELQFAESAIRFLNERVHYLFIGTHSRAIEGRLQELFFANRWEFLHQQPCHWVWRKDAHTIESMLHTDGEMFLRNPRFD